MRLASRAPIVELPGDREFHIRVRQIADSPPGWCIVALSLGPIREMLPLSRTFRSEQEARDAWADGFEMPAKPEGLAGAIWAAMLGSGIAIRVGRPAPVVVQEKDVAWSDIAASDHIVHLYADDDAFLETLEGYVAAGLSAGEGVIVIATEAHMVALNDRLDARSLDLEEARAANRYIEIDAHACLSLFMTDRGPDRLRFNAIVTELLQQAGASRRPVRAFGEMVAVLWQQGQGGATVELEKMWNEIREKNPFALLCAYPRGGFARETRHSLDEICAAHTKVIANLV